MVIMLGPCIYVVTLFLCLIVLSIYSFYPPSPEMVGSHVFSATRISFLSSTSLLSVFFLYNIHSFYLFVCLFFNFQSPIFYFVYNQRIQTKCTSPRIEVKILFLKEKIRSQSESSLNHGLMAIVSLKHKCLSYSSITTSKRFNL